MKKLLLVAPLQSVSGYGTVSRGLYNILKSLEKQNLITFDVLILKWGNLSEVRHLDGEFSKKIKDRYDTEYDLAIMCSSPYDFRYYNTIFRAKHVLHFNAMVESKPFHPQLFSQIVQFMIQNPNYHVVVPMKHLSNIFEESLSYINLPDFYKAAVMSRVHVVPNPTDEIIQTNLSQKDRTKNMQIIDDVFNLQKKKFDKVFAAFAPLGVERKNLKLLVEVFAKTGFPIVIFTGGINSFMLFDLQKNVYNNYIKLEINSRFLPENIKLVVGSFLPKEVNYIFRKADAFVNLSAGESWDYTLQNALIFGKPAVFVDFFERDYITRDYKDMFSVNYELKPAGYVFKMTNPNHPFFHPNAQVADVNFSDAVIKTSFCFENYDIAKEMAEKESQKVDKDKEIFNFLKETLSLIE